MPIIPPFAPLKSGSDVQTQNSARAEPEAPQPRAQTQPQAAENPHHTALPAAHFFRSEKTYGHETGFSCCFRQWRAEHSHCRFLHGYALSVRFIFIARNLDKHGWVMDFGGLKQVKAWLQQNFDHKILLSADDPSRALFQDMAQAGMCETVILPIVGCEAFAFYIWQNCDALVRQISQDRVRIESVEVREHGGNAALFKTENPFNQAAAAAL